MPARHQPCEMWTVLEKPMCPGAESRQLSEHRCPENLDRKKRYQADERAQSQWNSLAAGEVYYIVIEFILLVPQADPVTADISHCPGDIEEVFEELGSDVFIHVVLERELKGDAHQVERVHRHPRRAVSLINVTPARQRFVPVEYPDVVEPQKPALKDISALDILTIDPPGEVKHQPVEDTFEKIPVTLAAMLAVYFINPPRRPSVHRRIDITERPFISGQLAIGVHIPVARQQQQLVLGKARIDRCQGDGMKREIPGRIPWVFPFVRHRDDVGIVQMQPVGIASLPPRCGRRRRERVTV